MLRKFILLLLCVILSGCTQQGNGGQGTTGTSSTEPQVIARGEEMPGDMLDAFYKNNYPTVIKNLSRYLFPIEYDSGVYATDIIEIYLANNTRYDTPMLEIYFNRLKDDHKFLVKNYNFSYMTGGNIRNIKANFHIEFSEFIDSFNYQVFEITILTQDNITLKVRYDIDNQEFYDASEGALENDVMNFNAGMKSSLIEESNKVIDVLRSDFTLIDYFLEEYKKYRSDINYVVKIPGELNIPTFYTPPEVQEISTKLRYDLGSGDFTVNFERIDDRSWWNAIFSLYQINTPFNSPNDIYQANDFISLAFVYADHYSCNGDCWINGSSINLPYTSDGYFYLYTIDQYKQAVKDLFGIDSTYTLSNGTNSTGYYEDANKGFIITHGFDGDRASVPCGLYILDRVENNGIIELTYKKYDLKGLELYNAPYTPEEYDSKYKDTIMSSPTWTATLKYNPEKDLYQILSVSKE